MQRKSILCIKKIIFPASACHFRRQSIMPMQIKVVITKKLYQDEI